MNDTIAAPITAWGHSSVGIIRLSGNDSIKILKKIFKSKSGVPPEKFPTHSIRYGHIYDRGRVVDEVLVLFMKKPKTYTREDVVEISSHGGPGIVRKILELCVEHGARLAKPGEFTKRAFLNGRIDLAQAEAVADIINAKSEKAIILAAGQIKGTLSEKVRQLRNKILNAATQTNAAIDFPEDVSADSAKIKAQLKDALGETERLISTFETVKKYREGVKIAIVGKTNVGKSSLVNILSRSDAAIVTPIAGTTRDIIRQPVVIDGIPVELLDTAGIRKTARGVIEKIGMEKTIAAIESADIVLFLFDASKKIDEKDENIIKILSGYKNKTLMVGNKIDLGKIKPAKKTGIGIAYTSCLREKGIGALRKKISEILTKGQAPAGDRAAITNLRQFRIFLKVRNSLISAISKLPGRLAESSFFMEHALSALDEITGKKFREDMIEEIFSKFCIGK
ncbi:MAG: tRNA uridine-5-carboxymethylaminomethyl(34) synthesis GTPase MnmE [Elusimicrobia bacterium]|nr:tRNA uridine-5-carboxymethylaminomethyl(34) synthesis GTPase MnmE [Elusimicrobiota bacterium]